MSIRTQAAKRRNSFVELASNPLEGGGSNDDHKDHKIEIITSCSLITPSDMDSIIEVLRNKSVDNIAKLKHIEKKKQGLLFTSENLITLLELIPSIKTQISIIESLGPRLIDPKSRAEAIIGRYRFAEDKRLVQDVLKMRAHTLSCNVYGGPRSAPSSSGSSVRTQTAGRVLGGRGPGLRRALTGRAVVSVSEPPMPTLSLVVPSEPEKSTVKSVRRGLSGDAHAVQNSCSATAAVVKALSGAGGEEETRSSPEQNTPKVVSTQAADGEGSTPSELALEAVDTTPAALQSTDDCGEDGLPRHDNGDLSVNTVNKLTMSDERAAPNAVVPYNDTVNILPAADVIVEDGSLAPLGEKPSECVSVNSTRSTAPRLTSSVASVFPQWRGSLESREAADMGVGESAGALEQTDAVETKNPVGDSNSTGHSRDSLEVDVRTPVLVIEDTIKSLTKMSSLPGNQDTIIATQEAFTFDDRFSEIRRFNDPACESTTVDDSRERERSPSGRGGLLSSIINRLPFGRK